MAMVTAVVECVDIMVPLKMRSRLVQHLTKLTKCDVGHLFVVVMRSVQKRKKKTRAIRKQIGFVTSRASVLICIHVFFFTDL